MSYSDFKSLNLALASFKLTLVNTPNLFAAIPRVEPSNLLAEFLNRYELLATNIGTEKAKSELIIAPILLDIYSRYSGKISYFSGNTLTVDVEQGLNGECDFILSASPNQIEISTPIVTVVEAKDDNIKNGLGQCTAQLVGAQRFNNRQGIALPVYGAVTTGTNWKFLRLSESVLEIDLSDYFVPPQLNQILGILDYPFKQYLAGQYP